MSGSAEPPLCHDWNGVDEVREMLSRYWGRITICISSVLVVCSASTIYAGPRNDLSGLLRLRHREYSSYVTTGPEVNERVQLHRLMFHSRDVRRVRRLLVATLTKRDGWDVSVDPPGRRIGYERPHESVEYMSMAQYNFIERGINNPAWYRNGKLAPRAYRGGCVVQYYTTKR